RSRVRRTVHERRAEAAVVSKPSDELTWAEIEPVLDEEIERLPSPLRQLVIGHHLQGKTRTELAKELGLPSGSVLQHLDKARELLQKRLIRRGVVLPAGLLATLFAGQAVAADVSARLLVHTLATARAFADGVTHAVAASVACLAKEALAYPGLTPLRFGL